MKFTITINGQEVTLTREAAQSLYQELKSVFEPTNPLPNTFPNYRDPMWTWGHPFRLQEDLVVTCSTDNNTIGS